jgi:hypothetical protein
MKLHKISDVKFRHAPGGGTPPSGTRFLRCHYRNPDKVKIGPANAATYYLWFSDVKSGNTG